MALLKVEDLCLGYDGQLIIDKLNFAVEDGDYLFIVGENGSGKTTLIKTLAQLIKPISGKIIYEDSLLKNEIGYLPQQSAIQKDFPASVYEVVLSGCLNKMNRRFFYNQSDKQKALNNMEKMNIIDLKDYCYRDLSGGQQQRVLLARALCATSRLLLLDEPVAGLDSNASKQMYDTLEQLNKEGLSIIMISHDISSALKYANKILHIGDELFFATKKQYLDSKFIGAIIDTKGEGYDQ